MTLRMYLLSQKTCINERKLELYKSTCSSSEEVIFLFSPFQLTHAPALGLEIVPLHGVGGDAAR